MVASGAGPRQIRLPKASGALANELRAQILERDLQPGESLPSEAELIQMFGLSRGTVREALRLLEADGFIHIRRGPRGGIMVSHPEVDVVSRSLATLLTVGGTPLRSLFEFRKIIEPEVAAAAARDATDEQRQSLLDFVKDDSLAAGDSAFHEVLIACVDNDVLRSIMSAINRVVGWQTRVDDIPSKGVEAAGKAHAKIASAIATGDAKTAASVMFKHIEAFEKVMDDAGRLDGPILPRDRWVRYLRQTHYGE
jgi:GntR family transcriptional repressor for pyruvate dehydrogenase complex